MELHILNVPWRLVVESIVLFSPTMVTEIYAFGTCGSWRLIVCTESRALLSPYKADDEVHDPKLNPIGFHFHTVFQTHQAMELSWHSSSSPACHCIPRDSSLKQGWASFSSNHWKSHKATGIRWSTTLIGDMEVWVTYSSTSLITDLFRN